MSKPHSPKGLRISDEVHKALRIRAAETGESMGEIAERALRKELGMAGVHDSPHARNVRVPPPQQKYRSGHQRIPPNPAP